jgi:hypothetical protein
MALQSFEFWNKLQLKEQKSIITEEDEDKEGELPASIFKGFDYKVETSKSTTKRTMIRVSSADRDNDRDEIFRRLKQAGISAKIVSASSSVDPIDADYEDHIYRINVKPKSGGMQETTLNSSITELFPCIAFETKYNPKSVEDFHQYLMTLDVSKLKCVGASDRKAAQETINSADTSSKFQEKMKNAIGVYKYLIEEHNGKPIQNVFWGYRAKPKGVPSNHPGDMFIQYRDGSLLGVSLKAGGKKTKEPQLNTYVRPIFTAFKDTKGLDNLRKTAYTNVYSKIDGMPGIDSFDGGKNGRHKDRSITENILKEYDKKDNRGYEKDYDAMLEIMRQGVVARFNKNKDETMEYIKSEILRDAPDVPTIVIKAISDSFEQVTDTDELGVFLPQVKFIKAESSRSSKQDWNIELKSGDQTLTMKMSIRSNKAGHAGKRKLGQFPTGLAVKYNGLTSK